ncbi:hypothetical protein Tco_0868071 [Tanacetum coccineum]
MSTLLKLSAIAKSNNLKDMMILLFESENQKDLITADNMNMIAENLSIRVSEREMLIGELDNCPCTIAYDSAKLLREMNDSDLAKIRCLMASVSHIQIKLVSAAIVSVTPPKPGSSGMCRHTAELFCSFIGLLTTVSKDQYLINILHSEVTSNLEYSVSSCSRTPLQLHWLSRVTRYDFSSVRASTH